MTTEQFNFDHTELENDLQSIIANAKTIHNTIENKKLALSLIDLTTLNSTDTVEHVQQFTQKVNDFPSQFEELDNVAAI